ncbi:TlpA family protein disulfide reductase [Williamwhitmania taraxaci]|uniref:Thiol-disulfide isomerase or thioredoxin n=1 Tax=Williamwhitmania taraxaci TaxID=1640674 RepID=A0A1G6Q9X5_9BACT|nr:TlpA family protein disulfide reductase [Williamwhitmania taraxaci]SDC88704.1 Thiol-disulfide isomerase or thioredoxin [Williamwhitmania taraxaci]
MKKVSLFVVAFLICTFSFAGPKDGYQIKVKINGLKDTTLLLGHHFGSNKYVVDTIRVNSNGAGVFQADSLLKGGVYLVILPGMTYFEILVTGSQRFSVETDKTDLLNKMRFSGSPENETYLNYQKYMGKVAEKSKTLQEQLKATKNADSTKILKDELKALNQEVRAESKKIVDANPGTFVANILKTMQYPEQPEWNIPQGTPGRDSLIWTKNYQFYKIHFWDNVDLSDARLLRTPSIESLLKQYFTNIVLQIPDSIITAADMVLAKAKANDEVFQYTLSYLLNEFQQSNIMGMDAVFVHLAKRYYLSGQTPWVDKPLLDKIKERVKKLEPNLIGEIAPELIMQTSEGTVTSLRYTVADYTILVFWEPDCGHCQKVIPEIWKIYQKYETKGVKVFAVYTQYDKEKWVNYINEHKLFWINAYDSEYNTNFRNLYDIYSTPVIYLLNKDKKIIAKRIGTDSLDELIGKLTEKQ